MLCMKRIFKLSYCKVIRQLNPIRPISMYIFCRNTVRFNFVSKHNKYAVYPFLPLLSNNAVIPFTEAKHGEFNFSSKSGNGEEVKLSKKSQLKRAVKDYGATVVVFHVGISLMSLGACYLAVSNGLDIGYLLGAIGFSETVISSKLATGGSTMVISYAVHKMFAPVRIVITLSVTPFIVQYLRRIGILKLPKT